VGQRCRTHRNLCGQSASKSAFIVVKFVELLAVEERRLESKSITKGRSHNFGWFSCAVLQPCDELLTSTNKLGNAALRKSVKRASNF
jgi:hypothetical protein